MKPILLTIALLSSVLCAADPKPPVDDSLYFGINVSALARAEKRKQEILKSAPVLHGGGEPGVFVVSIRGNEIGKHSDEMDDFQTAMNFDPILRQQILDAMTRQKKVRESK